MANKYEIIQDTIIRNRWHKGFQRLTKRTITSPTQKPVNITEIVLHGTGGYSTYEWVRDGGRKEEYVKGVALFHYLIETEQMIREIIDPNMFVFHSTSGWHDSCTIGIEIENKHKINSAPYTDWQYGALFWLVFDHLIPKFPTIKTIISHNMTGLIYSRIGKACPGAGFDWSKLENEMNKRSITFTKIKPEIYRMA